MPKISTKFKETDIGPIPEEWEVVNIGEALEIIDGDRGVNYPNESDFLEGDYCLFLNAKNVCGDSFDFSNCQFISKKKDLQLRKGKMQRGDFVLTTRGTVGNIAFYDKSIPFENMRINSGMVILRNGTDFDSKYLFQLLKSLVIKNQIIELTTGSAQPQLPIRDINFLKLVKPPLREQCRIAEILSSLDDKIELNRKINANLEKLASTLFKKWFVDIGDKLPEGWRMGKVSDLIKIESGFPFNSSMFDESGNYELVTIKNVQDGQFVSECTDSLSVMPEKMPNHCKLKTSDILLSLTGNVGRICIVTGENYLLNQRVAVLVPINERDRAYTYLLFRQKDFQNTLMGISRGTAQQNLSPIETRSLELTIPSDEVLKHFALIANPIFEAMVGNFNQIKNFSVLRDSLLPRLMSGKIRTTT